MLKTAMSGYEYDKEAFLGGTIAKAIGKGFARLSPTIKSIGEKFTGVRPMQGFKNMMNASVNRLRSASTSAGKQITPNHLLYNRKVGKGTPFKINGAPRKSTLKNTADGKFSWDKTPQQAASRGAQGNPETMSAKQFSNKPPATSTQEPLNPPEPSAPVSPESPGGKSGGTGGHDAIQQLQNRINKLEKKNKKLKKNSKSNVKLSDMDKSYRQTSLYKNFGYKPVIAGGGLAAYYAGSSGNSSPVIVNN